MKLDCHVHLHAIMKCNYFQRNWLHLVSDLNFHEQSVDLSSCFLENRVILCDLIQGANESNIAWNLFAHS